MHDEERALFWRGINALEWMGLGSVANILAAHSRDHWPPPLWLMQQFCSETERTLAELKADRLPAQPTPSTIGRANNVASP